MKNRPTPRVVVWAGFVLLYGCSAAPPQVLEPPLPEEEAVETAFEGPPPARRGEALQTDQLQYEAQKVGPLGPGYEYEFSVIAEFTNPTVDTLFLANCSPGAPSPTYQIGPGSGDPTKESVFDPSWACVGNDDGQLPVPPGASRRDTFLVSGPNILDFGTLAPVGIFEGWWRLSYGVRTALGESAPLAADSIGLSNVFEIRIEP